MKFLMAYKLIAIIFLSVFLDVSCLQANSSKDSSDNIYQNLLPPKNNGASTPKQGTYVPKYAQTQFNPPPTKATASHKEYSGTINSYIPPTKEQIKSQQKQDCINRVNENRAKKGPGSLTGLSDGLAYAGCK